MRPYVAHNSRRKIRCCFLTVVVKNKALIKHYKGGLKGFMDKYSARCNHDIAVDCYMGGEVDDTIKDLLGNGLTIDEDFTVFDAGCYALDLSMNSDNIERQHTVELGVNWLKALYTGEGFYVWYAAHD